MLWKCVTICQFLHEGQDLAFQVWLTFAEQRGRITSLELPALFSLMHPRMLFGFSAMRAHCWLMFKSLFTRTLRSSSKLLFSQLAPHAYWWMGLFLTRSRTFNILLLNFTSFLFCPSYLACPGLSESQHTFKI